jgi:hypothetical protein
MDIQEKQEKQIKLKQLSRKLYLLRQWSEHARELGDIKRMEEYNTSIHKVAQQCTVLQLELELDEEEVENSQLF